MRFLPKIKIDKFVIWILLAVILANFIPIKNSYEQTFGYITTTAISILFFVHGAKLSRKDIIRGITNWRIHLLVLFLTFMVFPLLGLGLYFIPEKILKPTIYQGFVFLCVLPSTIQSSIIFTSTARGNVAGAICSASISSILGIFVSPFLAGVFMHSQMETIDFYTSVKDIFIQLMLPFIVGHLSQPLFEKHIKQHPKFIKFIDQSSIILVVYNSFSKSITEGLWNKISLYDVMIIVSLSCLLLFSIIFLSKKISKALKFSTEDEITIVFCGSKKSMVNGIPMANIIFPIHIVGTMILPLMFFHQIQLIVSSLIAQRYAKRPN